MIPSNAEMVSTGWPCEVFFIQLSFSSILKRWKGRAYFKIPYAEKRFR